MAYSQNELEFLRQYRAGQGADVALLEDPDPQMTELYAPMGPAANDPSAGLPAGAVAGPDYFAPEPQPWDFAQPNQSSNPNQGGFSAAPAANVPPTAAEEARSARDAAVSETVQASAGDPLSGTNTPAEQARDEYLLAKAASESGLKPGMPASPEVDQALSTFPRAGEFKLSEGAGTGGKPGAPVAPPLAAAGASPQPQRPAMGTGGGALAGSPFLKEYMKGRDKRFDPLGIPVTREEAAKARLRQEDLGMGQVVQAQQAVEYGRKMADAQYAAEATKAGYAQEIARRDKLRSDTVAKMEANMRNMFDDAAKDKIDAERYWNNKSTGENILARIALALGAFGASMTGAPNFAFEALQNDINRDIDAQKQNRAFKQSRAVAEGSLIQMARDRFDDEHSQDLAMQAAAWHMVDGELQRFASMNLSPQQKTAIEMLESQVAGEREGLDTQIRQQNEAYAVQVAAAEARARAAAARPKVKHNKQLFVPKYGYARDAKSAGQARDLAAAAGELNSYLDEMDSMAKKSGTKAGAWGVGTKEYKDAVALRNRVIPIVAKINAGGFAPSEGEREAAQGMVPDPAAWSSDTYEAQSQALRKGTRNSVESTMGQLLQTPEERELPEEKQGRGRE